MWFITQYNLPLFYKADENYYSVAKLNINNMLAAMKSSAHCGITEPIERDWAR